MSAKVSKNALKPLNHVEAEAQFSWAEQQVIIS